MLKCEDRCCELDQKHTGNHHSSRNKLGIISRKAWPVPRALAHNFLGKEGKAMRAKFAIRRSQASLI